MEIRMICMDLDGTALQADVRSFSPRLSRVLLEAHRRGVAVTPVTGRQFVLLPEPVRCHPAWEGLAVLCNGTEVRRLATGEVLAEKYMQPESLLAVLDVAEKFSLSMELSSGGTLHLTREALEREQRFGYAFHQTVLDTNGKCVPDLRAFCLESRKPVEKVNLLCVLPERKAEVERALGALPFTWSWSSDSSIELTRRDADKASGMLQVCAMLGIAPEQVLALGDSGNDISMLRSAGLGVAMGNAPEEVRAAARAVTGTNVDDGAAAAIERYVLQKMG